MAGVGHLHVLGNPKENRAGFAGDDSALRAATSRYETVLDTEEAAAALGRLAQLASTNLVAVLCFEATEQRCHRYVVLSRVEQHLRHSR